MKKTVEIPGYVIKKALGEGGMARVYLAKEKKLERSVALKVLSPALAENPRITRRFIKEAKTAAQLQHTNIISIFDVGKHKGDYYIAMEKLAGNLKDQIMKEGGIKPAEALSILKGVSQALSYAHNKGFIHRDIKPDNIMFRGDGTVVLVDFGIVKAVNESERTKLTRTGMSIGTPQYMSPEQIKARRLDGRSDIYSLGIVFYEMLTGKLPYNAKDVVTLVLKHTGDPIPQLPKKLKQFQPLLEKMVAKRPAQRVKNAEGLIRLIDSIKHDLRVKTERIKLPVPPSSPTSGKWLKRLVTASVLIFLSAASVYLMMESKKNRETAAWQQALSTNSVAAYDLYMETYPEGKHLQAARDAIHKVKAELAFNKHLKQARSYYRQQLYSKALLSIAKAKQIKSASPEVQELQNNIASAIEKLKDDEYNDHLTRAQQYYDSGDLETANEFLQRAKKIKVSDTLILLEQKLKEEPGDGTVHKK